MSLTLYYHPLASFCWKVLIALYENDTAFTPRLIDLGDPADQALMAGVWPVAKMPALIDQGRGETVAETSIIIDYLDQHHPGPRRMIPADPDAARQVRLWDRFFDLYVHDPMQRIVVSHLFMPAEAQPAIAAASRATLDTAYKTAEAHLQGRDWAAGDFGMADCAAMPALFYAGILHPFEGFPALTGYAERLFERPSCARVLAEAKPYFDMFPFVERMPERFR
ncbi:glutathione S-transferase family protein [uncultured Paracoccus sp.]|uniref:glutathione S-transferase family protein n=1 Tax=uncultured Paracoccus sp. TaxID=189685 RepID=UPI00262EEDF7|nr:glutathione S-transferase family protein [uncultured Paracoccus sp.]